MRVNLSYSVELEEVLPEVGGLFAREKEKFIIADNKAMNTLKETFNDDNAREIVSAIEEYKAALFNFDVKLGEIQEILKGYHEIANAPSKDAQPEEETLEASLEKVAPEETSTLSSLKLEVDDDT